MEISLYKKNFSKITLSLMTEPLPVIRTQTFQRDLLKLIPKKQRRNFLFNLENISVDDLDRFPNLKTEMLKPFKSYHFANFRILFVYCFQCFHKFNHKLNCRECDEDNLERIILIDINHRSNAYRYKDSDLTDFTLL